MASGGASGPAEDAFTEILAGLGLEHAAVGQRVESSKGPALAGIVEHRGDRELMVRTDEPAPGIALLLAYAMGPEHVHTHAHLYLYGDAETSEAEAWRDWMAVPSTS